MDSIRTISCKLQVDPHQAERIEATLQAFADACNFVAEWGCTHKVRFQYALHKGCYQAVRERFGLSANLAVRATVGAAVTRPEYSLLSCPLPQWVAEAAG